MGTLNKYLNSAAVEEALDKGVAAYSQVKENKTDILLLKENAEFTPRFIGQYSIPWFIEGRGMLTAKVTQLQKNVFSININGGGSIFDTENSTYFSMTSNIPIACFNPSNLSQPYSSHVLLRTSDAEGNINAITGIVAFTGDRIVFNVPTNTVIGSIDAANIIVYGELIEEETTE